MGNWQLEVFRMALYMSFPVALFHYFNQPQVFEEWVTKKKLEIYPVMEREEDEKLRATIRGIRERQEATIYQEMESNLKN